MPTIVPRSIDGISSERDRPDTLETRFTGSIATPETLEISASLLTSREQFNSELRYLTSAENFYSSELVKASRNNSGFVQISYIDDNQYLTHNLIAVEFDIDDVRRNIITDHDRDYTFFRDELIQPGADDASTAPIISEYNDSVVPTTLDISGIDIDGFVGAASIITSGSSFGLPGFGGGISSALFGGG